MLITESKIPFIIFIDGADGVGKTTVAVELAKLINSEGINTGIESILGCTTIANLIKEKAINDEDHNEYLNFLGFCYSTFTGIESIYKKSAHTVYIVDRSHASTFAQNICSSELNSQIKTSMLNIFNELNKMFIEKRNNTFANALLELKPQLALDRIIANRKHLDNFEKKGVLYQEKIQRCFRLYFEKNNLDVLVDTENKTPEQIASLIYFSVRDKLKCHLMTQLNPTVPSPIYNKNN